MRKTKILIINAYSAKNIGDGAIIIATIKMLRRLFPESQIKVMSAYAKENSALYKMYDAESIESTWPLTYERSRICRYMLGLQYFLKALLGIRVPKTQSIQEADLIISAGGGYLFSSRRGALGAGFLNALFHIWLALHFKKPVCIFPKSVGPINFKVDQYLLRAVLKRVNLIFVREPLSLKYLESLRLSNIVACPDIAFSLRSGTPDENFEPSTSQMRGDETYNVGITVLDWQFFRQGTKPPDVQSYLDSVVEACLIIKDRFPQVHFYIFVQVAVATGVGAESDRPISDKLHQSLGEAATLIALDADGGAERVIDIYGRMDVFIASRMHSAIFALCAYVPTIALVYQQKTLGTFTMLDLSEFAYDVQSIDSARLSSQVCSMLTDRGCLKLETAGRIRKVQGTIDSLMDFHLRPMIKP